MIICGTGHRPDKLGGYDVDSKEKLLTFAHSSIKKLRPDRIITGMALGWDMALAYAADAEKIPFTAAIPFKGQEKMWPEGSQKFYHWLLEKADEVIYVCEEGYAVWKMQKRNEWMVDNCDTVLALWDGSAGGTGNCIVYANKVGKPIINLWDRYE